MKTPARRLQNFPSFRERRDDFQFFVAPDQSFIDMRMMGNGGGFLQRVGIERFEFALVGVAQGLAEGRGRRKNDDRSSGRCKQQLTYRHWWMLSATLCSWGMRYR